MLRVMSSEAAKAFIARWAAAGASERANGQPFLCELCDMLGGSQILETLCAVGKARRGKVDGTFLP